MDHSVHPSATHRAKLISHRPAKLLPVAAESPSSPRRLSAGYPRWSQTFHVRNMSQLRLGLGQSRFATRFRKRPIRLHLRSSPGTALPLEHRPAVPPPRQQRQLKSRTISAQRLQLIKRRSCGGCRCLGALLRLVSIESVSVLKVPATNIFLIYPKRFSAVLKKEIFAYIKQAFRSRNARNHNLQCHWVVDILEWARLIV